MIEVVRATENYQKAGAYHVRIEGMGRQHHISLRNEFDEHDFDESVYIVILDDGYPVGTCRMYPLSQKKAMLGRVVVLPVYRGQGLGKRIVKEAEDWLFEMGYDTVVIESRVEAVEFYQKMGYCVTSDELICGVTFQCIRMEKRLK